MNLFCPFAADNNLRARSPPLPPPRLSAAPSPGSRYRVWMAERGMVPQHPRAAEREGSAGAAGRCPRPWCQGRGTSSQRLPSPCRGRGRSLPGPGSERPLCPYAAGREPAEQRLPGAEPGRAGGTTGRWGPSAHGEGRCLSPAPADPQPGSAFPSPPPPIMRCRVRLVPRRRERGGGQQPEEPSC